MEVHIKNCNNIVSAQLSIEVGKLNIRLAPNGTGKSTISKAVQYAARDDQTALEDLMPFILREHNPDNRTPNVAGVEHINNVMCFDEDYVSRFTFQPDEVISNSFDIFIRTDEYKTVEAEINHYVGAIQQQFTHNPDLETLISNLKELNEAFRITTSGGLSKASTGMKGLSGGNKISNIPPGLEAYQPFIQSPKSVSWIDWQTKGHKEFTDLSKHCPFCTTDVVSKKEQIAKVSQEYDKNLIKNLLGILEVVNNLGAFLSEEARDKLHIITSLKDGIEKEHENYIVRLKAEIDTMIEKLEKIRTLSGFHFDEGDKIAETLAHYKVDLQFFRTLESDKTKAIIDPINRSIESLIEQAGPLQGKINIQRRTINELIERHEKAINDFLRYAGYRYKVAVVGEGDQAQLKLLHIDNSSHLSGGSQHLSFGERNAFSIVLFMYECLAKNPDLIILDDPVSSFDINKKYATLEMLFRRDADHCLKSKTVLMLTHDVEPIIDTLKSVRGQFSNQVNAAFLRLRNGEISEQEIKSSDLQTFVEICKRTLSSPGDPIVKLIYLRRKYEVLGNVGDAYEVLSNLFKKRDSPIDYRMPKGDSDIHPPLSLENLAAGLSEITSHIDDANADYASLVALFKNTNNIKALYRDSQNGYEKLQLTRILINTESSDNAVIRKFINETYHIENEFIFQLDPSKFDLVPEYIVKECDEIIGAIE